MGLRQGDLKDETLLRERPSVKPMLTSPTCEDAMINQPKTRRGAMRQYNAVIRLYHIDFVGGGMFGWDWPTFRLNSPALYERAKALRAIYASLPA